MAIPGTTAPKILLAENDPAMRGELSRILRDDGLLVVEAPDGTRALELIEEGAFDLVLLELAIPGLNGFQLAEKIQSRFPEIPIIFMGAYVPTSLGKRILRGKAEFIEKEGAVNAILPAVQRLLRGSLAVKRQDIRAITYRKRVNRQSWHFSPACSNWPTRDYEERATPLEAGEFCNECRAKGHRHRHRFPPP